MPWRLVLNNEEKIELDHNVSYTDGSVSNKADQVNRKSLYAYHGTL